MFRSSEVVELSRKAMLFEDPRIEDSGLNC